MRLYLVLFSINTGLLLFTTATILLMDIDLTVFFTFQGLPITSFWAVGLLLLCFACMLFFYFSVSFTLCNFLPLSVNIILFSIPFTFLCRLYFICFLDHFINIYLLIPGLEYLPVLKEWFIDYVQNWMLFSLPYLVGYVFCWNQKVYTMIRLICVIQVLVCSFLFVHMGFIFCALLQGFILEIRSFLFLYYQLHPKF